MGNEHLAAEAVASKVLGLAAEIADQGKTVSAESVLRDLGFDDLSAIELMMSIEDDLEIVIDVSEYYNAPEAFLSLTLQALIDAALKAVAKSPVAALPSACISHKELEKAPKLTPADIEAVIVSEHYFTAGQGDARAVEEAAFSGGALHASGRATPDGLSLVTFCVLILRNGAKVTGVNHGPVSAANFNAEQGRKMARENAIEKVWELEGYALRERLAAPVVSASFLLNATPEQKADLLEKLRKAPSSGLLLPASDPDAGNAIEALRQAAKAMRAFTDPEGNMPADTGEFNDLKQALAVAEGVLDASGEESKP